MPPTPATPLSPGDLSAIKAGDYKHQSETEGLHTGVRKPGAWDDLTETIGGCTVRIECDRSDRYRKLKLAAIRGAVARVRKAGFVLPDGIRFVCSGGDRVRCIMFASAKDGGRSYVVYLGPQIALLNGAKPHTEMYYAGGQGEAGDRGIANHLYDENKAFFGTPGRDAQAEAIVVHELGHLLHEYQSPDAFWCEKKAGKGIDTKGFANTATQISHYSSKSTLEFVAEVFTAALYGKAVPAAALEWYLALGGPTAPGLLPGGGRVVAPPPIKFK